LALNSRNSIDPRWVAHNRLVIRGLQLAQVEIYNPGDSAHTYDAATNTWSGAATEVYSGRARVQPINSVSASSDGFNPTLVKAVRVQISYTSPMPDIRPNFKMRITSSPNNDTLTQFIYIVTDVLNSSNAWERTLLCKVDTELDPTETS
jgi:hypothetical protein